MASLSADDRALMMVAFADDDRVPQVVDSLLALATSSVGTRQQPGRMRCGMGGCGRRVTLAGAYACRCGRTYCQAHRPSESHDCTFDFKAFGQQILRRDNPIVRTRKVVPI
ncbi:AN1-type domain-containing protein [Plasmodiophora brassicae]